MARTNQAIENEILKALLLIVALRRSEGELDIDQNVVTQELKDVHHTESDRRGETQESAGQELVPLDLLQLVLKPDLPADVLELIAKLLNNDPAARQALVKVLTSNMTSLRVRSALTAVLTRCAEHGYTNALDVLEEALTKVNMPEIRQQLTKSVNSTSRYVADTLRVNPTPLPTPSPFKKWL